MIIVATQQINQLLMVMKKYKKGVAFGTWDCLHFGHIEFFKLARGHCERLTVAVDSDEYALNKKGKETYHNFRRRCSNIDSIKEVFVTVSQNEKFQKEDYIKTFKPDVIFVGTDHKNNGWEGQELAEKYNIDIVYIRESVIHSSDIKNILRDR